MKNIFLISQLTIIVFLATYPHAAAGAFQSIAQERHPLDSVTSFSIPISALITQDSTLISASGGGIYIRTPDETEWRQAIPCATKSMDWWEDCYGETHFSYLYSPAKLWNLHDSDSIVIFDNHCGCFLALEIEQNNRRAALWRNKQNKPYVFNAALQNDFLICNAIKDKETLTVQKIDAPDFFKRIFRPPPTLTAQLDPVGADASLCIPAFNPNDSTIWININGYRYIYVLDLEGTLIDSVAITAEDWIPPAPPASRIRSMAVWKDWESRWTPTTVFRYAPPGYFILQYRTGWERARDDSIPLYSTTMWDATGAAEHLDLDHRWQLAGVHADGRLVFGHYECEDAECRVVLDIVRLVP